MALFPTKLLVITFKIIKPLIKIAPPKYAVLFSNKQFIINKFISKGKSKFLLNNFNEEPVSELNAINFVKDIETLKALSI